MHPIKFRDPFTPTSQPLYTVVLIPARFDSTRLPGKPLADIAGSPMIEHVYRRAAAAEGVDAVAVATDDKRIVAAVAAFGGVARLTKASHQSGTDRIAELAAEIPCEIVINLQADEPTTQPETITNLAQEILKDSTIEMATVRCPITDQSDYTRQHQTSQTRLNRSTTLYQAAPSKSNKTKQTTPTIPDNAKQAKSD